jgi:starch-binding outer membrane protein, SusD/RagB family
MKKILIFISIFASFLFLEACDDFLNIQPLDKVDPDLVYSTSSGIKTVLANLYQKMPIEDFTWTGGGFNQHPGGAFGGWHKAGLTDEAVLEGNNGYQPGTPLGGSYWDYTAIREVNKHLEQVLKLKNSNKITEDEYNQYYSEAHFIQAYIYWMLARRYGGVPLIDEVQQLPEGDDYSSLYIPRATEKDTWDFILNECDLAIANLPLTRTTSDGVYRATKWAALALKSRVALHAASIAKYWNKAPLTGDAVSAGLIGGMTLTDANRYYQICITASKDIIDNSGKQLYKPTPANKTEAAKNYQDMFETPSLASVEIIFQKSYIDGSSTGQQGHDSDFWLYPTQCKFHNLYMAARFGATLDIVDAFEDYTDNGAGASTAVKTRSDGVENVYVTDPKNLTTLTGVPFILYNTQYDPFKDKDVRMLASVICPGSMFHGTQINMQGGLIQTNGKPIIYTSGTAVGLDGNTYYTYGSQNETGYSGFGQLGTAYANYSSTGFALRKTLQDTKNVTTPALGGSTQPYIDFRLAEMYLNYAEATVESGLGDASLALKYLNDIRKRAGHTDQIQATIDNILKERRVEFVFEGIRYWDLVRRRDFHLRFSQSKRTSLIPLLDLRQNPPKYVFLRVINYYDQVANGRTYDATDYYHSIPGVATNKLIQNPGY